jgi:uncharacterized protein YciI
MLFAVMCLDKDDGLQTRLDNRPEHIAYLKGLGDKVIMGGPYTTKNGEQPIGSLLIIEAEDEAAIKAIAAGDPYAKAGLFKSVEILPWKWTVNSPEA